jgi:DNA-binding transcriptional ArsR family regulator
MISEALMIRMADRLRVLGQPVRLRLVEQLIGGSSTPQHLSDALGLSQQNVSKHLLSLHRAGIVSRRPEGANVFYALADDLAEAVLRLTLESVTRRSRVRIPPPLFRGLHVAPWVCSRLGRTEGLAVAGVNRRQVVGAAKECRARGRTGASGGNRIEDEHSRSASIISAAARWTVRLARDPVAGDAGSHLGGEQSVRTELAAGFGPFFPL